MTASVFPLFYDIPEELLDFRAQVRRLAQERIAPRAREIDTAADDPWAIRRLLAENAILACPSRNGTTRRRG